MLYDMALEVLCFYRHIYISYRDIPYPTLTLTLPYPNHHPALPQAARRRRRLAAADAVRHSAGGAVAPAAHLLGGALPGARAQPRQHRGRALGQGPHVHVEVRAVWQGMCVSWVGSYGYVLMPASGRALRQGPHILMELTLWIAPMRMSQQGRMLVESYTAFTEVDHFRTTAHAY